MCERLDRWLRKIACWQGVVLLVLAYAGCAYCFEWRKDQLGRQNHVLDGRCCYDRQEAHAFLANIGPAGRRLYAVTQLTLDVVCPLVYGALLGCLIVVLHPPEQTRLVLLFPLLAVVADLLENLTTAYLACSFDGAESPLATAAGAFTFTKWSLVIGSILLVGAGLILLIPGVRKR